MNVRWCIFCGRPDRGPLARSTCAPGPWTDRENRIFQAMIKALAWPDAPGHDPELVRQLEGEAADDQEAHNFDRRLTA